MMARLFPIVDRAVLVPIMVCATVICTLLRGPPPPFFPRCHNILLSYPLTPCQMLSNTSSNQTKFALPSMSLCTPIPAPRAKSSPQRFSPVPDSFMKAVRVRIGSLDTSAMPSAAFFPEVQTHRRQFMVASLVACSTNFTRRQLTLLFTTYRSRQKCVTRMSRFLLITLRR